MILRAGKNRVRNLLDADKERGILGRNRTLPHEDQTSLIDPVAGTLKPLTSSLAERQLILIHFLSSLEGNGEIYREYGNRIAGGTTFLNRVVFADLPKSSAEEFQISTIINIP